MFSVRIVTTDHYQSTPIPGLDVQYSDLRGSDVWKVPVVRIYGSTPAGQKTCMHVHGVFPYLYVPYDGTQPWDRYLRLFANSLDKALNVSLNHANSKSQHVYKINLVSGIPMYGYHDKEEQFLKIFLYNPGMVKKAADLLLGGAVMNKAFQPHESHIPYVLQMFIDYNLYGMNMLNVAAVKFRRRTKDDNGNPIQHADDKNSQGSDVTCPRTPTSLFDRSELDTPSRKAWNVGNIPEDMYLDESVTRQSTCELECDIVAPDILNRLEVDANVGTNPGLAALWEDEKQRKRNMGESSQITPPDSQEREDVEISERDELLRLKFLQIIQNHQPYLDSQTEEESQESAGDFTPASALDLQLSQDDVSNSSQVTVLVEDDDEENVKPIISLDSIKRVVSMSQSFSGSQGSQPQADTQDKSLAEILASLANESSPSSSQEVADQIITLEEKDSILLDKSEPISDEIAKQLEEETLEMSQVVWEGDDKNDDEEIPGPSTDFNMEGLDDSWNVSQFLRKGEDESEDEDVIPQFDGAIDEKPDKPDGEPTKKKRLGVRGPVVGNQGQGYHGNIAYNQGSQYPQQYNFNNQYMYHNWQPSGQMTSQPYNHGNQPTQSTSSYDGHENMQSPGSKNSEGIDNKLGYANQVGMSSPQFTASHTQAGFVSNYGNLQSPSHYPSPHSSYGNLQNHHGSYSNLSSTSSLSNIQSPHDSSHGGLHSPALSSHSNLQSPSQIISQGNTHDNHGTLKSPNNEDSHDGSFSSKSSNQVYVQAMSQPNVQQSSQNLQSPLRMTPSPEVHDDFTIHHFSKDGSQPQVNPTQSWSQHNSQNFHRNMNSSPFSHPNQQNQFYQISQQSRPPYGSNFQAGQYVGQKTVYSSNDQQMQYTNKVTQSFNQHFNYPRMISPGQSVGQPSLQSSQPNTSQTAQLHISPSSQKQSVQAYTSPTGVLPSKTVQSRASSSGQQHTSSKPMNTSSSGEHLIQQSPSAYTSFAQTYYSTDGQRNMQSNQPYMSPNSQQNQTMIPTSAHQGIQRYQVSHQMSQDGHQTSETGRSQQFPMNIESCIDNQHDKFDDGTSMETFPNKTFQEMLSEDQSYPSSLQDSRQVPTIQSQCSPVHNMDHYRFQHTSGQQGNFRNNIQGLPTSMLHQFNGPFQQQQTMGGYSQNSQGFPGGLGNPRMQIRAKVAKRGRRPKNMTDQNATFSSQDLQNQSMLGFEGSQKGFPGQMENPTMQAPVKAKRGRKPKYMTEPNPRSQADYLQSAVMKKIQKKQLSSAKEQHERVLSTQSHMNQHEFWQNNIQKDVSLAQMNQQKLELSLSATNLQRIPSAVSITNDNQSFPLDKSESRNLSMSTKRQPTTLELLLLYGDESVDKNIENDLSKPKQKKSSEILGESVENTSVVESPQPSSTKVSQTLSPNGSADLFSDSSQSSLTSRPLNSTPEKCDTVSNRNTLEKVVDNFNQTSKTSNRSSLSSLASLVCNVSPASSFGYHYDSPVKSSDSSIFLSPEPFISKPDMIQVTPIRGCGSKSPGHLSTGNKSSSHSRFESKSPSHLGFGRSISYDGTRQFEDIGTPPCNERDSLNSQGNLSTPSHLNHSWSGYNTQDIPPHGQNANFMRSQSFSFDQQVKGAQRRASLQQIRCRSNSVSKKPPQPPNAAYTFTFHVPTPVYKRLKFAFHKKTQNNDIKIVRMHPMDARRYSLLKIGREIVKAKKLTQADVEKSGIVLKAPLNELLMAAKTASKKRANSFHRSLSYNSVMKAPYDIKTKNINFMEGVSLVEKNNKTEKVECDKNLSNKYPQKMIVPPAQTLASLSEHCHTITKVTLASIIDNVLMTSMQDDNANSETTVNNHGVWPSDASKNIVEMRDSNSEPTFTDLSTAPQNSSLEKNASNISGKKLFESYDTQLINQSFDKHHSNMIQKQPLQNSQSAKIPHSVSGSFLANVMFPNHMTKNFNSETDTSHQNMGNNDPKMMVTNQTAERSTFNMMVELPKDTGQVCKKIEKQPRRKNLMLCRKRSMNKMLTSSPSVIDPDLDDQDVILKDVSLIEASEGTLTPIKSRTPVTGRSPIRPHVSDAYKLFDSEDLDAGNGDKIFPNIMIDKESDSGTDTALSRVSSRTSSRVDSSESVASLPAIPKEDNVSQSKHNSVIEKGDIKVSAENITSVSLLKNISGSHVIPAIVVGESPDNFQENGHNSLEVDGTRKRKASSLSSDFCDLNDFNKKVKEKENIDNSELVGKFKGCKQMVVSLTKVDKEKDLVVIENVSPKIHASLTVTYGKTKWTKVKNPDSSYSDISSESSQDCSSLRYNTSNIKTSSLVYLGNSDQNCGYFQSFRKQAWNGQNDIKQKRKSSLSINRKLQVAFLSKKRKQKKKAPKITGKLKLKTGLNSIKGLSLLHEATLANLTETTSSQTENAHSDSDEDLNGKYEDVLFKMALYSSPETDSLDSIPPQPFSPEELSRDHHGISRSTSDAQSPALESENSVSPTYSNASSTDRKCSPVYPSTYPRLIIGQTSSEWKMKVPKEIRPYSVFHEANKNGGILNKPKQEQDCSDSLSSSEERSNSNTTRHKKLTKKAFVKLKRLSSNEIHKYKGINFDDIDSGSNNEKRESVSPPDLGPPNIPKYPNSASNDDCDSPPKLLDQNSETPSESSGQGDSPVYQFTENSILTNRDDSDIGTEIDKGELTEQTLPTSTPSADLCIENEALNILSSSTSSNDSSNSEGPPIITLEKFENQFIKDATDNKIAVDNTDNTYHSEDTSMNTATPDNIQHAKDSDISETNSKLLVDNVRDNKFVHGRPSVITPRILPPSRKHVTDTAISHGLNLANNQAAFCSNPDDVPDKPRELGGRILKIESRRVSDLTEFSSSIKNDGLSTWRQIVSAGDQFFDSDDLVDRFNKEPQLRFALMGDKSIVLTPCNPAPTCKTVTDWLIGRQRYKILQLETKECVEENKNSDTKNEKQDEKIIGTVEKSTEVNCDKNIKTVKPSILLKSVSFSEPCDKKLSFSVCDTVTSTNQNETRSSDSHMSTNHIAKDIPENGENLDSIVIHCPSEINPKRSVLEEIDDNVDDDDMIGPSPPDSTQLVSQPSSRVISDRPLKKLKLFSSQHRAEFSPILSSQRSPLFAQSMSKLSSQKTVRAISPGLHSTPVSKIQQSDLIQPACTPINHLDTQKEFLTPKRIPLSKRTSVGSGKNMRRSLMASQLQQFATPEQRGNISQIDGPTPKNSFGFQISQQNFQDAKALHEVQNLTVLSMELLAETRGDNLPDPEVDAVQAVFYSVLNDVHANKGIREVTGVIMVDPKSAKSQREQEKLKCDSDDIKSSKDTDSSQSTPASTPDSQKPSTSNDTTHYSLTKPSSSQGSSTSGDSKTSTNHLSPSTSKDTGKRKLSPSRSMSPKPSSKTQKTSTSTSSPSPAHSIEQTVLQKSGVDGKLQVTYVENEMDLFQEFIDLVMKWDPDMFVGYEIQKVSWGYLLQRAAQIGINLCSKISRIPEEKRGSHFSAQKDEYGADHMSEIHVVGRIVLNLWRVLKHQVTLNIYTFENVMYHVLHQRTPLYSFRTLNSWYNHRTHLYRWKVINYFTTRVQGNLQMMDQVDLIGQTSEFARVFGIEFYHVLSRGSQFRVESMMLRLAKPMNFIPVSPNVHQRARMRSPECIQLTLEPESRFYHDPVVVLDFQSLYPSIMIAYNYCFSTCVGRIDLLERAHEGAIEFGCTHLRIPPSVLKKIKDDVTVSPNGVVFVKQHVRKGIISAMVEEILNTRVMVKKAMKDYKNDKTLYRLLDARQLGLKLIANVTYGYTAANFSGRMPCVEVGDSIVRKARETLERSIKLVEDTPKWGAKVVYGDTDSMFILLKGRSKDDAFKIGYEICDAVTAMHPSPIKLKFEKVYLPCVLQTKKRYVGFSYETPDQKEPVFDAKGIETVRRDACPAVAKILERSIKVLFTTRDVSQVKQYVQNQCRKLMEGKVSMLDLIFAKEYRGMPGYKPGACVPALEISRKLLRQDRRSEPSVGERVPYVVVYGSPGLPLIQLVRQPSDLLSDPSLRINAVYYITKQILPPLGRMLQLLGVDVFAWYNEIPKFVRVVPQSLLSTENRKGTISQYFASSNCPVCDKPTNQNICSNCIRDPQMVAIVLNDRIRKWETVYHHLVEICNSCMGTQDEKQPCASLDCPILFRRNLASQDNLKGTQLREVLLKCLDF